MCPTRTRWTRWTERRRSGRYRMGRRPASHWPPVISLQGLFCVRQFPSSPQRQPAQHRGHADRRGVFCTHGCGAQDLVHALPGAADRGLARHDRPAPGAALPELAGCVAHPFAHPLAPAPAARRPGHRDAVAVHPVGSPLAAVGQLHPLLCGAPADHGAVGAGAGRTGPARALVGHWCGFCRRPDCLASGWAGAVGRPGHRRGPGRPGRGPVLCRGRRQRSAAQPHRQQRKHGLHHDAAGGAGGRRAGRAGLGGGGRQ